MFYFVLNKATVYKGGGNLARVAVYPLKNEACQESETSILPRYSSSRNHLQSRLRFGKKCKKPTKGLLEGAK